MGLFDKISVERKKEETLALDKSEEIRKAFVEALGEAGKEYLKDLSLYKRDWYKRHITARAFGRWLNPVNVPLLIPLLKDKSENIRDGVAETLKEIGSPAVESLIQVMRDESQPIRYEASKVLGEIEDKKAVEPLIQTLKDENEDIRRISAWALGMIKDKRAVEPLIQVLKDESNDIVRRVVILALGEIGDASAVEPLTQALNDKSKDIQKSTKEALKKMRETKRFYSTLK